MDEHGERDPADDAGAALDRTDSGPAGVAGGASRRRPRRRRRVPGGRRNQYLVKLSDAEDEWVRARALVAGVSVPRLLAEAALSGDEQTASERRAVTHELVRAKALVGALGNNLNQLAKVANSTGRMPAAMEPTLHAIASAMEALKAAAAPYADAPKFGPVRRPTGHGHDGQDDGHEHGQGEGDGPGVEGERAGGEGAA